MIIISSTGGGGSSWVADQFQKNNWFICLRPDGGPQKASHSNYDIFKDRTKGFFTDNKINQQSTLHDMWKSTYKNLKEFDKKYGDTMLLCMSWGGLGFLREVENDDTVIYLIRNPLYAYKSYSGLGWRSAGGKRRMAHVGAKDQNDLKWVDLFLGDFSMWLQNAKNALRDVNKSNCYIVRYHTLKEDWLKIPDIPNITGNFECKDDESKLEPFLTKETINYIKNKTNNIWKQINQK